MRAVPCRLTTKRKLQAAIQLPVIAFFFSQVAESAPPFAYDGWAVANGVITSSCPAGAVTCGVPITDNGFFMRKVTMSGNIDYFQYIITDPGATGDPNQPGFGAGSLPFSEEHITRADNSRQMGVFDKTLLGSSSFSTPTIEDRLYQISTMEHNISVDANDIGGIGVTFEQQLSQIDWSGASPVVLMNTTAKGTGQATNTTHTLDEEINSRFNLLFTQDVALDNGGVQKFQNQLDLTPIAHTADLLNPLLPGGTNGGDISWTSAQRLNVTWVGQSLVATPSTAPALFSYTGYAAGNSSGVNKTYLVSLDAANPPGNINAYFTPGSFYDVTPDIDAPPPLITPTAWSPLGVLTGRNDHVASPLSGTGGGGPPIALGSWTVSNGTISADCPVGVQCGAALSAPGFYQRGVLAADGGKYFQTIITAGTATGDPHTAPSYYYDSNPADTNYEWLALNRKPLTTALAYANESFVRQGSGEGVSSRVQIVDATLSTQKSSNRDTYTSSAQSTVLNTGWAQGSGASPVLQIRQVEGFYVPDQITQIPTSPVPSFLGASYGNQFDLTMAANGAKDYEIVSVPWLRNGFYTRTIEGGVQSTQHALTDPALVPGGSNGGNISWTAGDSLRATWIGNYYGSLDPTASFPGLAGGQTAMGMTAYTNLTTGETTSLGIAQQWPLNNPTPAEISAVTQPPAPWQAPFDIPAPPYTDTVNVKWPDQDTTW